MEDYIKQNYLYVYLNTQEEEMDLITYQILSPYFNQPYASVDYANREIKLGVYATSLLSIILIIDFTLMIDSFLSQSWIATALIYIFFM